jgi:hypothetical protein
MEMQANQLKRNASQVYLSLVPILVSAFGLGVGYISYKIYLPVWIINVCLMVTASWTLGLHVIRNHDVEKKHLAIAAFFLIVPWILISMFFGLGPPPQTPAGWVATATEQEIRYIMLIIAGVFIALGFAALREKLKNTAGSFYSMLGFSAIMIAIPLFIVNMIFWSAYVPELFRLMVASGLEKRPEWTNPVREEFNLLAVIEVSITYLAGAAISAALRDAGWLSKIASRIYIIISLLCFTLIAISTFAPEPIATIGSIFSIPALPFIMPYLIGINLLRRAGN